MLDHYGRPLEAHEIKFNGKRITDMSRDELLYALTQSTNMFTERLAEAETEDATLIKRSLPHVLLALWCGIGAAVMLVLIVAQMDLSGWRPWVLAFLGAATYSFTRSAMKELE